MTDSPNIVLAGFMGTGKTSVGRILAQELNMSFIDMDSIIEERAGKAISLIFAEDGESHFREIERDLVSELSNERGKVIATGGGIVVNSDNVTDFSHSGLLVCLSADPETILARVAKETHRPLLEGDDKRKSILTLLESRRELYNAIEHQVDTSSLSIDETVSVIITMHNESQKETR